jgi:hypothetical protein
MELEDFRRLAEKLVPSGIGRSMEVESLARDMMSNPWLQDPEPVMTFTLTIGTAKDMYEIKGAALMTPVELRTLMQEFAEKVDK